MRRLPGLYWGCIPSSEGESQELDPHLANPQQLPVPPPPSSTSIMPSSSFPLFPRFPPEIRFQIWKASLCRERIIKLDLRVVYKSVTNHGGRSPTPSRKEPYRIIVNDHNVLSKLLRVSYEARRVALSFYHIRVPCYFLKTGDRRRWAEHVAKIPDSLSKEYIWPGSCSKEEYVDSSSLDSGYVYLNPQYDFASIEIEEKDRDTQDIGQCLIDFIHKVQVCSPLLTLLFFLALAKPNRRCTTHAKSDCSISSFLIMCPDPSYLSTRNK